MKKLVVLTGAGISAESGFATFRDSGGLWEKYDVRQVATPEGWQADPDLVTAFYNSLRTQLQAAQPNRAHRLLAELEREYDVTVVTQNVDGLHARAAPTTSRKSLRSPPTAASLRQPTAPATAAGCAPSSCGLAKPCRAWRKPQPQPCRRTCLPS